MIHPDLKELKILTHLVDVFPRCCDITNKGMHEGWHLGGTYIADEENAIKWIKKHFNQTWDEFWTDESDEYYYTDWNELEDCDLEAYLSDGTYLEVVKPEQMVYKDEDENYYKITT